MYSQLFRISTAIENAKAKAWKMEEPIRHTTWQELSEVSSALSALNLDAQVVLNAELDRLEAAEKDSDIITLSRSELMRHPEVIAAMNAYGSSESTEKDSAHAE